MVGSIPNDIFQFSIYTALNAGFNTGQPRTADLTTHGTDGIGVYEDGSLMMLKDGQALTISKNGRVRAAPMDARLPFAMVTIYQPNFHLKVRSLTLESFDELISSSELGPAKCLNTLMPFKIAGRFASIDFADGAPRSKIDGTIFGFVVPAWMKLISGERIHAHFLDASEEIGGEVTEFQMDEEAVLSFAKCGRFHLGFPQGEEWEEMKL
ncbi:alpha-acetolactate decarboxylase [Cucurbitaria berberidis CBS 394.84]|uniref:Alpha-acetolactate decarboxylase n=1 Tax=Cucurbitaria berberidis CBS 394.84 TaxID=1168544 RepID=A0A9P4LB45_9PLEO|nr:alpha-acetolactate decarboxylase [Cucurbitaria berberidis CBS 394.84]KAF1847834.1 alpha-acetolactate decarboxylase [Cucurbitaria berberidis CBS 394.84]